MKYFKLADDRTNYDIAYNVYRTQFIRENFVVIVVVAVVAITILLLLIKIWKKKVKRDE